jgi:hypothetical protein
MVRSNPDAHLTRLDRDHTEGLPENLDSTISFFENMMRVISDIIKISGIVYK